MGGKLIGICVYNADMQYMNYRRVNILHLTVNNNEVYEQALKLCSSYIFKNDNCNCLCLHIMLFLNFSLF